MDSVWWGVYNGKGSHIQKKRRVKLQDGFYIRDLVEVSWSLIRDTTLATGVWGESVERRYSEHLRGWRWGRGAAGSFLTLLSTSSALVSSRIKVLGKNGGGGWGGGLWEKGTGVVSHLAVDQQHFGEQQDSQTLQVSRGPRRPPLRHLTPVVHHLLH